MSVEIGASFKCAVCGRLSYDDGICDACLLSATGSNRVEGDHADVCPDNDEEDHYAAGSQPGDTT